MLVALREEKELTRGIIKIINKFLITLVYKATLTVSEWGAAIFIRMLIQRIEGFERAPMSEETAELISLFTIVSEEEDLKEPVEIPKFTKAKNWKSFKIPEQSKITVSKTSDNETSSWNMLDISENILEVNYIGLNEENNL